MHDQRHGLQLATAVCAVGLAVFSLVTGQTSLSAEVLCPPISGWSRVGFPEIPQPGYGGSALLGGALTMAPSWESPGKLYAGGVFGLYETDDCGNSWNSIPNPGPAPTNSKTSLYYVVLDLSPTGRLFTQRALWRLNWTMDQGQTWHEMPVGFEGSPEPLYFQKSGVAWGMFYHVPRGGATTQTLARSTDDGITWMHGPRGLLPRIFCVDAQDDNALIVVQQEGVIVRTTDMLASSTAWAAFSHRVDAVMGNYDRTRYWVATDDRVLHQSLDDGQTWNDVSQIPGRVRENGLRASHLDPNVLFVVTEDGELWAYRDAAEAPSQVPRRAGTLPYGRGTLTARLS